MGAGPEDVERGAGRLATSVDGHRGPGVNTVDDKLDGALRSSVRHVGRRHSHRVGRGSAVGCCKRGVDQSHRRRVLADRLHEGLRAGLDSRATAVDRHNRVASRSERGSGERCGAIRIEAHRAPLIDAVKPELYGAGGDRLAVDGGEDRHRVGRRVARERGGDRAQDGKRRRVGDDGERAGLIDDRVVVGSGPRDLNRGTADSPGARGRELRLRREHRRGLAVDKSGVQRRERRLDAAGHLRQAGGRDRKRSLRDGQRPRHERNLIVGIVGIGCRQPVAASVEVGRRDGDSRGRVEAGRRVAVDKARVPNRESRQGIAVGNRLVIGGDGERCGRDRQLAGDDHDLVVVVLDFGRRDVVAADVAASGRRGELWQSVEDRRGVAVDESRDRRGQRRQARAVANALILNRHREERLADRQRARLDLEVVLAVRGRGRADGVRAGVDRAGGDGKDRQAGERRRGIIAKESAQRVGEVERREVVAVVRRLAVDPDGDRRTGDVEGNDDRRGGRRVGVARLGHRDDDVPEAGGRDEAILIDRGRAADAVRHRHAGRGAGHHLYRGVVDPPDAIGNRIDRNRLGRPYRHHLIGGGARGERVALGGAAAVDGPERVAAGQEEIALPKSLALEIEIDRTELGQPVVERHAPRRRYVAGDSRQNGRLEYGDISGNARFAPHGQASAGRQ